MNCESLFINSKINKCSVSSGIKGISFHMSVVQQACKSPDDLAALPRIAQDQNTTTSRNEWPVASRSKPLLISSRVICCPISRLIGSLPRRYMSM